MWRKFSSVRREDDIMISRRVKIQSLGMSPWYIPEYLKKTQASKLGYAQGIPFFISNLSGHFWWNYIFIQSHHMHFTLIVCLFLFSFVFCNNLSRILTFLCGRETRSAFSCEYSYSSFISVEYSCLVTINFQLLFFMHLLSKLLVLLC